MKAHNPASFNFSLLCCHNEVFLGSFGNTFFFPLSVVSAGLFAGFFTKDYSQASDILRSIPLKFSFFVLLNLTIGNPRFVLTYPR